LEDRNLLSVFTVANAADSGMGSLRQAILDTDASADATNLIQFAIPGTGVHTINLLSPLPAVTRPVLIDGYTQAGASANTREVGDDAVLTIELNGAAAGSSGNGLTIQAANVTVRGLVVNRFRNAGIVVSGPSATQDLVAGNFIGTNVTGTAALANGSGGGTGGVLVVNGAHGDTVGGDAPADRNLISGNNGEGILLLKLDGADTRDNTVANNYIGTSVTGTAALGNTASGIFVPFSTGNQIRDNLVSGNLGFAGIALGGIQPGGGVFRLGGFFSSVGDGSGNVVTSNLVGTDATGTAAVANLGYGISVDGGTDMTLGGTTRGTGNVISGNHQEGIDFFDRARNMRVLGNRIGTDGAGVTALANTADGISITAGSNGIIIGGTVGGRNLISGNTGNGISLTSGATGNLIQGNHIGVDVTGTHALGNQQSGVSVAASGNTIGGTTAGARNLLSGNRVNGVLLIGSGATGNLVLGNFIGTDVTGTAALGNGSDGVRLVTLASRNTIGGTAAGAGNLISGNTTTNRYGIDIDGGAASNLVQGNFIGTDVTGTRPLANFRGIDIGNAPGNTIGGTAAGARNVISANIQSGILLDGVGGTGTLVQGNLIGTDSTGTVALGNGGDGIHVFAAVPDTTIGGTAAGGGNLISGNVGNGIRLERGAMATLIQGNLLGTDIMGTLPIGNRRNGVLILDAFGNQIGGTAAGARNLISGNTGNGVSLDTGATGNLIQGNNIGTDVTGTRALGNGQNGVWVSGPGNTLGGTTAGARNLVSGNRGSGVVLTGPAATGDVVAGNYIGTNALGNAALGNASGGTTGGVLLVDGAHGDTVGGAGPEARNLISGNNSTGVIILKTDGADTRDNTVENNYVGTNALGNAALPNTASGIFVPFSTGNQVRNNLVSGNLGFAGIALGGIQPGCFVCRLGSFFSSVGDGSGNVVAGNLVGTDATGTAALGNAGYGISVDGGSSMTLGGTALGDGNVVSGNGQEGIVFFDNARAIQVLGNRIGTDGAGVVALRNTGDGISITGGSSGVTVGGTAAGAGNLISGNRGNGVSLSSGATGSLIQGNDIGTDVTGSRALGNGANGVLISGTSASNNTIGGTAPGAANTIAYNSNDGVLVNQGTGNAILHNPIFSNGKLGIELTNGGNHNQAAPVLILAVTDSTTTTVQGTLTSSPNATFAIELFANTVCDPSGYGQGEQFLASFSLTTDAAGHASFTYTTGVIPGEFMTATATSADGNTSQFSNCVPVIAAPTITCSVADSLLWPPNHRLVNVGLSVDVQPPDASLEIQVYANDDADSSAAADIGPGTLRLRAERNGHSLGRVYLIVATAVNLAGSAFDVCSVVVPHDNSPTSVDLVRQEAASAEEWYRQFQTAPPGFHLLGQGPMDTESHGSPSGASSSVAGFQPASSVAFVNAPTVPSQSPTLSTIPAIDPTGNLPVSSTVALVFGSLDEWDSCFALPPPNRHAHAGADWLARGPWWGDEPWLTW
jgi:hypothetical protein